MNTRDIANVYARGGFTMRRAIAWLLIALIALQCVAFAENTVTTTTLTAVNGQEAVSTTSDIYLTIPAGQQQMLVRVSLSGADPVCVDRADQIEDLIPYGGGVAYLKTTDASSAIMKCVGNDVSAIYSFGASTAVRLTSYGGKLLVMLDGLLHSIEPATQLCLKLSGAEMLDYVLGDGCAYFLSAGDQMEYTAQLDSGETAKQAGCIYRLDLNSGETTLLLKSGGEDLKLRGTDLYFHNLADAYAVRIGETAELQGRVYSMDVQLKTLNQECAEPDSGFWPLDKGLVCLYGGALNLTTEAGVLALYSPEEGARIASDGSSIYVWEPGKQTLSAVMTNGTSETVYTGDLTQAINAADILPEATATAEPTAEPAAQSDENTEGNSAWFDQFMQNKDKVSGNSGTSSSSGNAAWPEATPIGWTTPTPAPQATFAPTLGSIGGENTGAAGSSASTGSNSSSGASSSSGSSGSSSNQSTGKTYSVDISYVKITGGSVNVRSKAGMNGSVLGSVAEGTVLKCSGVASKDSSGMVWYKVSRDGKTGWVSSKYAKKTSSSGSSSSGSSSAGPEVSMSGKYVKLSGSVNLRSKPSKTSSSLGTISSGKTITFLNKVSTDSRGVVWFKVKYNGKTGWVSSAYAKVTDSAGSANSSGSGSTSGDKVKIVDGSVTIRSKPDKNSERLGAISKGKTATYLGSSKVDDRGIRWYKIKYNGVTGWVSSMYAKLQ